MKKICGVVLLLCFLIYAGNSFAETGGKAMEVEGLSFVVPQGWKAPRDSQPKKRKRAKEKIALLTKDGFALNRIEIKARQTGAEFAHTKKQLHPGMLPQEIAQVVLHDFELNQDMKNFLHSENKPFSIAGRPGFRLVFSYKEGGNLQYRCVYYGFLKGNLFYSVWFTAPQRHYFSVNIETFEELVRGLRLYGIYGEK